MITMRTLSGLSDEELIEIIQTTDQKHMALALDALDRVSRQKNISIRWVYALVELSHRYGSLMNEILYTKDN